MQTTNFFYYLYLARTTGRLSSIKLFTLYTVIKYAYCDQGPKIVYKYRKKKWFILICINIIFVFIGNIGQNVMKLQFDQEKGVEINPDLDMGICLNYKLEKCVMPWKSANIFLYYYCINSVFTLFEKNQTPKPQTNICRIMTQHYFCTLIVIIVYLFGFKKIKHYTITNIE